MKIQTNINFILTKSIVFGLALAFFINISIFVIYYFITNRTADIYTKSIRTAVLNGDLKELKKISINSEIYFQGLNIELIDIKQNISSGDFSTFYLVKYIFYDVEKNNKIAKIIFYLDINYVSYFALLIIILSTIFSIYLYKKLRDELFHHITQNNEKIYLNKIVEVSKQVAHDIRSPVSVLNLLTKNIESKLSDEQNQILNLTIKRIDSISNDLLQYRSLNSSGVFNISHINVSEIIGEHKIKLDPIRFNLRFVNSLPNTFTIGLSLPDFQRVFSNILNNAIESIDKDVGNIQINLFESNAYVILQVIDNGTGIHKSILDKLGQRGFSFGKANGNGLGLSDAKKKLEQIGGRLEISSIVNVGTTVTLFFPLI